MSTRIIQGDQIIAKVAGDNLVGGREVIVEKPDVLTRIIGAVLAPAGIGLLGLDAVDHTRYVDTGNGNLQEVKEVIHRSK